MGSLWFAINLYQEEFLLPGCLDSIRKSHPEARIVAVDGAYQSFVNETKKLQAHHIEYNEEVTASLLERFTSPVSTDRTHEILKDYGVDVVILPERDADGHYKPWAHEYEKRSKYFVGRDDDYYFVIDADERVVGRLEWERLQNVSYNVMIKRDENVDAYPVMRVHKHVDGMSYQGAHHALWVNGTLWRKEICKTVEGVKLDHLAVHRVTQDPIRHLAKGAYYRVLTSKEEGAFRAQYGL